MSLETWKAEFYPIAVNSQSWNRLTALQHSLQKWRGLRKSALYRHGLVKSADFTGISFGDEQSFLISSLTCALCELSLSKEGDCSNCPLFLARGERCDEEYSEEDLSPYHSFTMKNDPEPMIVLIELAIMREECLENPLEP